ncbi:hypothetical protein [Nitrincola sp. A-D6]|uniref:hypothetical protein n=1 Tax=Nitrincola sp. A-D6 TaxID=1545442 RepID=UPI001184D6D4|nr:hypothetical protein [Nitrincola sp. A-D6]
MSTIYILGGGAIGLAVARLKAITGASVTLITRHPKELPDNITQIHIASWDWNEIIHTLHNLPCPISFWLPMACFGQKHKSQRSELRH